MADSETIGQGNELTRALAQRRKVVDTQGSKFVKDPLLITGGADVSWDEHHESQFTPRGRSRKTDPEAEDETSQNDIRINSSAEGPDRSTIASRSSKAKLKPSAKSRLTQFAASTSANTASIACAPEPMIEAAPPCETGRIADDVSLPEPAPTQLPSFGIESKSLPTSMTIVEPTSLEVQDTPQQVVPSKSSLEGVPKNTPESFSPDLDVTSPLLISSAPVESSPSPHHMAKDLDVTSPLVTPVDFVVTPSEMPSDSVVAPRESEQDRTMSLSAPIFSAAPNTTPPVYSDSRKTVDPQKFKLLLPKEVDFKLPLLGELPLASRSSDNGSHGTPSVLIGNSAVPDKRKKKDLQAQFSAALKTKFAPDVAGVFDKRKSAASELPPSTSSPAQTVHDKKRLDMMQAPPDVAHVSSESAGQHRDRHHVSDQRLWRAVVEGNVRILEDLADQGILSSGKVIDHNGHSVFWNAVAFQQLHTALWLLTRFPPDVASGVDMREIHARRNDSLLHMCLYFSEFNAGVADLFQRVFFCGAPRSLLNQSGQSFLSIAAGRLNFWAIRFAVAHAPDCVNILLAPDKAGNSPLVILAKRVSEVSIAPSMPPMQAAPEMKLPVWFGLKQYKPVVIATDSQMPIFSDLILEVEDPSVSSAVVRIAAHRVVVGACSSMLDGQMQSGSTVIRVDANCCRSVEVVLALLHFCYSGELALQFQENGLLVWQLLCLCVQYGLPAAMTSYVRAMLVRLLIDPKYAEVASVLLQASEKLGLTQAEASFTARIVLASPQLALGSINGASEKAALLDIVLSQAEQYVSQQTASSVCAPGKRLQAQNVPILDVFNREGQLSYNRSMMPSAGGSYAQPPPTPALGSRNI